MLICGVTITGLAPAAHASAVQALPGCTANVLPRNDDTYSGPVSLGFDFRFGNQVYSSLRINNNGFVTFGEETPVWHQLLQWENFGVPLIALYHADIDTRGVRSTPVSYGPVTIDGRPALCINWVEVGYFDSQDDRLDSFQLILVGRSDQGVGDADIVMNYGPMGWDTVQGGGSTLAPRVGVFNGASVVHELPGSNTKGTLIDGGSQALSGHASGSPELGRYVVQIRGGLGSSTAVISGRITDVSSALVAGAIVASSSKKCAASVSATTDSAGNYVLAGFAPTAPTACNDWQMQVSPPTGSTLLASTPQPIAFTSNTQVITDRDVVLRTPAPLPATTTIAPSSGEGDAPPRVYWRDRLTLSTPGCPRVLGVTPQAEYMITSDGGQDVKRCHPIGTTDTGLIRCGEMTNQPGARPGDVGVFVATIDALAPAHGAVTVTMKVTCDPSDSSTPPVVTAFDMYIDPSGVVRSTRGTPLVGATVRLYRSDYTLGPFAPVSDGSAIMAPENRNNPDFTDAAGRFAWDTLPGFYVVRAESPGCVAVGNPAQPFVETGVLPVPPPQLDLPLVLDCEAVEPPALTVPSSVRADATSTAGARVHFAVSAADGRDGAVPVTCSRAPGVTFPLGRTIVDCSARDSSGNVARASFPVTVTYAWSDVLPPLHPADTTCVRPDDTIPVEFALTGGSAPITNLSARLFVARVRHGVVEPEVPARSAGFQHGMPAFVYDRRERRYEFAWSTHDLARGDYRLRIDLGDGELHTAAITVRRRCSAGHGHHPDRFDGERDSD